MQKVLLFCCSLLLSSTVKSASHSASRLGHYNVNTKDISVSGLSSGAFFSVQFHVAFSSVITGMGAVAGGPFWCAKNNLNVALNACMVHPELISVPELIKITYATYTTTRTIDDPGNMKDHRVFLFSGTLDTVVVPGVVRKLEDYYSHFTPNGIDAEYSIPSEHSMVTDGYGNSCGFLGPPFINNCKHSTAYHILSHIYGGDKAIKMANFSSIKNENLLEFDQTEFFAAGLSYSMDKTGYVYVPENCKNGSVQCQLHIAFHGCKQGRSYVSNTFALYAGYNQLAEVNNLVILYPQATYSTVVPYNPNGCWDWWGYSAPSYASKIGPQMAAVKRMLDRITTNS